MIHDRLAGFRDPLHELFFTNGPLIFARIGMDHGFTNAAVSTADTDVLVGAAKAALRMTFEMGENHKRIIVQQIFSDAHVLEPLAAMNRQVRRSVRIHDIHRTERPAIDL